MHVHTCKLLKSALENINEVKFYNESLENKSIFLIAPIEYFKWTFIAAEIVTHSHVLSNDRCNLPSKALKSRIVSQSS